MTRILPELQRRLLMRKLKLMDGHGVPDAPRAAASASRGWRTVNRRWSETTRDGDGAFADRAALQAEVVVDRRQGGLVSGKTEGSSPRRTCTTTPRRRLSRRGSVGLQKGRRVARRVTPDRGRSAAAVGEDYSQSGRRRSRRTWSARSRRARGEEALPFELVGLEVALEMVCNQLERDRRDVGQEVRASLAGLRKKVDTFNLERVRRVKSKVTALTGRVAKVREEIKRYLDDDSDMRDMYLTRKAMLEDFHANEHGNAAGRRRKRGGEFPRRFEAAERDLPFRKLVHGSGGSFKMRRQSLNFGGAEGDRGEGDERRGSPRRRRVPHDPGDGDELAEATSAPGVEDVFGEELFPHQEDSDLQVVEDLLETYFAHIDSTYAELDAIDQFINDTEDFVNIQLDVTRNQLQKFEVTLTSATLCFDVLHGGRDLRDEPAKRRRDLARHVRARERAVRHGRWSWDSRSSCCTSGASAGCESMDVPLDGGCTIRRGEYSSKSRPHTHRRRVSSSRRPRRARMPRWTSSACSRRSARVAARPLARPPPRRRLPTASRHSRRARRSRWRTTTSGASPRDASRACTTSPSS